MSEPLQKKAMQDNVSELQANAKPLKIAVFASGSGSNFQAIADAVAAKKLNATIELLVCDKPQAKVVERAEQAGIRAFTFTPKNYASKAEYEQEILRQMEQHQVDLIVLAGYMRIVSDVLVQPYFGRMINIHPSLLPAFPGAHGMADALAYGVKVTGVTIHYVDGGMDTGPIIAQRAVAVEDGDTEDTLAKRIHEVEHGLMIEVLQGIASGLYQLEGRIVRSSR